MRPFTNLNSLEILVQWLRLISSGMVILLSGLVCLAPFTFPKSMYMSKLDAFSADITQGLFDVLRLNMETASLTSINNGVGLTTSELVILTEYTAQQVRSSPQYIVVSLYGRCDCTFTTEQMMDSKGRLYQVQNSTTMCDCIDTGSDYIFDYREVLSKLGLGIILDYAYSKDGSRMGLSTSYSKYINSLRSRKVTVTNLLYAIFVIELVKFCVTFWYYYIKGRFLNIFLEQFLVHTLSIFSLTVFICGLTSVISLAWLNYTVQARIKSELQSFGFSYHLGASWFTCLWMLAFFVSLSCFVWSGLEWCIAENYDPRTSDLKDGFLDRAEESQYENPFDDENVITGEDSNSASSRSGGKLSSSHTEDTGIHGSTSYNNMTRLDSSRIIRNFKNKQFDDTEEQFELQSITLRSSTDSDSSIQRVIQPSSTMHF